MKLPFRKKKGKEKKERTRKEKQNKTKHNKTKQNKKPIIEYSLKIEIFVQPVPKSVR